MSAQVEKLVDRAVGAALGAERLRTVEAILLERRRCELAHGGLKARLEDLERQNVRNSERIRALERVEDHRHDYVPPDVMQRLEGLLDRLREIGR